MNDDTRLALVSDKPEIPDFYAKALLAPPDAARLMPTPHPTGMLQPGDSLGHGKYAKAGISSLVTDIEHP
jgi:hypothetical protein